MRKITSEYTAIRGALPTPIFNVMYKDMGHAVAQLVEELRYKPEGRGFDS
jgi:hypothetical protein